MTVLPIVMIVAFAAYQLVMFRVGRRPWPADPPPADLLFVFVLPCLDEELVIGESLDRLRALPLPDWAAIVVDDDSTDDTGRILDEYAARDDRIRVLHRRSPHARRGKGAALNAAYQWLRSASRFRGYPPTRVILVVVDADGRIDPGAPAAVAPYFADPRVGGAQIAVRIHNARRSLLARLQDIEFVAYTDIFQRARRWWGTAGLGGNGQFTRLSALRSLGDRPWSRCLTEDLDLGIRLVVAGWRTVYVPETRVTQQGLTSPRRLIRQRTRWFQGNLQCLARVAHVLEARQIRARRAADIALHLTLPVLLLSMTFPALAFWLTVAGELAAIPVVELPAAIASRAGIIVALYVVAFGPGWLYGTLYRRAGGVDGFLAAVAWGHVFVLYAYLWLPAGWWAIGRAIAGRAGWAKTLRLAEQSG
jgi:cellulose synthase/poly-beta-1,6-N-acetylglucosamine synthase-like glycosyltransferase